MPFRLHRSIAALAIAVLAMLLGTRAAWSSCCAPERAPTACCASKGDADRGPAVEAGCCCEIAPGDAAPRPRVSTTVPGAWHVPAAPRAAVMVAPPSVRAGPLDEAPPLEVRAPRARVHLRNRVIQR